MNIRSATLDDWDVLTDLHWRSSMTNEGDREWMLAHRDIAVFEGEGLRDGHVRIAEIDGTPVGFATSLPRGAYLELEDLFVDPDWMRRGIATALLDDVRERARQFGVTRIEVSANDHALAFYKSVGFVQIGMVDTALRPVPRMHLVI